AAELAAKKNKKKDKVKKPKEDDKDAVADATPAPEADAPPADDKTAEEAVEDPKESDADADKPPASPSQTHASLAQQSKLRSASFRQGSISLGAGPMSPGPFSPTGEGETATDIYKKHVARIEELEKENKRLAKESADAEKRWQKAEEEMADLREDDGQDKKGASASEVEELKAEKAALERQNAQLQQQVSRSGTTRHGSSPSVAVNSADLEAELQSKSSTVESMELEISKLRARLERGSTDREQITALEERVERAEKAAGLAQRELSDVRRNLDRTAEKAVREGSERTSAETKIRNLEHDLADAIDARLEAEKKADGLEKKIATLTTLHKEQDSRTQALRKDKERAEKEARELRTKVESLEAEAVKLRSRRSADGGGGLDDEGVDELENEERGRLQKTIRDLEAEVHDLRRGVWQEKRRQLSSGNDASPGAAFQDIDLGRTSPLAGRKHSHAGGGIGDFFTSGINALTGHNPEDDEGFLDDDDDMDFDEDAFRRAQEEDAKARIERIKEIKRGLKNWEGWRLDLVETRRGGEEGIGEVFEV
ncbi:M protein repeat protein, partial [Plectosphaerella plurivora]